MVLKIWINLSLSLGASLGESVQHILSQSV